jgi:hypothetical protein
MPSFVVHRISSLTHDWSAGDGDGAGAVPAEGGHPERHVRANQLLPGRVPAAWPVARVRAQEPMRTLQDFARAGFVALWLQ